MKMDLDETIEQILEIFDSETEWKKYKQIVALKGHRLDEANTEILNIEGTLRERLKTLLTGFEEDSREAGKIQAKEHREPALPWSDLD